MSNTIPASEVIAEAISQGLITSSEAKAFGPDRPVAFPACHPNASWLDGTVDENGKATLIPVCSDCGRSEAQANAHAGLAGLTLNDSLPIDEAKAQLYRCILDIMMEDVATPDAERMARWQRLSSGFWAYQHKLFDDLKERGYFSAKWDAQRAWSIGRTVTGRTSSNKKTFPASNDSLTLADLGL